MRILVAVVGAFLIAGCGGATQAEDAAPCATTVAAPTPPAASVISSGGDAGGSGPCESKRYRLADPYVYDLDSGLVWNRAASGGETPASACITSLPGARPATAEEIRDMKSASSCAFPAPFAVASGQIATPTGCIDADTGADVVCEGWWRRSLCVAGR